MTCGKIEPKPLLEWVLQKFPDTPRSRAKQWITAGRVSVDGVVIRKPHEIISEPGSKLELLDRHSGSLECGKPWQIHPRVSLVYLDSSLAIVNKGSGIISVPAPNADISALSVVADFLAGRLKPQNRQAEKPIPAAYRRLHPLPVHRLDEYTSGLFCIALNPAAREHLINQLREHTMRREYVAYVEGRSPNPKGTWRHWLQLSKDGLRQQLVTEKEEKDAKVHGLRRVEAITHYEVIAEFPIPASHGCVTKLKLTLETGRKHQIRIQAAKSGLPLIGDRTYNPRYHNQAEAGDRLDFPRQALHAQALGLEHPEQSAKRLSWTAELPKDLRELEARLRSQIARFGANRGL
jgi:23S rRNA pseudouridine1911/1915/1917 synthase